MQAFCRTIATVALSLVSAVSLAQDQPKPGPWFSEGEPAGDDTAVLLVRVK